MKYKNKHTSEFDKKIQISDCMFNIYKLFTVSLEWNSIEYHTIKNKRKTKSLSFKGLILFLLFIFICLVLESILSEGIEILLSSLIFSSFQIVFFVSDVLSLSLTYTYKEAQGREMSVWCVCKLPSSPSAQYWPMTVWCEHSDVITHHAVDQSCMTWIGKKEREEEKKRKASQAPRQEPILVVHFNESALEVASFTPDTSLRVRKYTFFWAFMNKT